MAAYAALLSLLNTIDQIQNHPLLSTALNKNHTESLSEKIDFLLHFIESYSSHFEDLESQIVSTVHEIEDIIESHIVDQILDGSIEQKHTCLLDLQKVIADMGAIKEKAMKVKEERELKDQSPTCSIRVPSSRPHVASKTSMVGFEDYLIQLMDVLTGHQRSRQILSIVGMGGTGKTTLAKNVYEHMVVTQYFDIRAWATISQEYSVREIMLELLSCKDKSTSETDDVLGERLYKHLFGRRYLLILDDMWSTEVWDKMKFFFPDNGNGSRIVITTRISNMAFRCSSLSFEMNFLSEDDSWKLFSEKVFGEEDCPDELVNIGKMIVEQCRGLPLSIVVIGGHLRKSSRTREHWENVADDMKSILNSGEDEQCLNILSLSYTHLPAYLKPCFLYMGIFPEDDEIRVSRLIKLWIAEGFLRPYENQSLEEVAKEYLKDLVDRNLILVRQWSQNEKIRTCSIHDLLRELCLKVAEKEKFLCVLNSVDNPRPLYNDRRVAVGGSLSKEYSHNGNFYWYPIVFHALRSAPFVRSLICDAWNLSFDFLKLIRVLVKVRDTVDIYDVRRLDAKFQRVNLRYLERDFWWGRPRDDMDPYPRLFLPSSISRLWSLQTLIISGIGLQFFAPREIWELPMLRHLLVSSCIYLPNPPSDQQDVLILRNLQTLSRLTNFKWSDEVCKRIPNVKKLKIGYGFKANPSSYYNFNNLGRFHELESLSCGFADESDWCDFSLSLTLPCSLRKVSLTHCFLDWKDLAIFSSLPRLEVLKLEFGWGAIMGHEWNPIAGGFPRLKSLIIQGASNLIYWNADNSHFPVLKNLTLRDASKLDAIPPGIGEMATLRCITLLSCSVSAAISAMRILVEQEEFGNDGFLLDVRIWDLQNVESFKEMVRKEGLKSNNFRLNCY